MNLGTALVLIVVVAVVAAITARLVKDKKSGKAMCGGDCSKCHGLCPHSEK